MRQPKGIPELVLYALLAFAGPSFAQDRSVSAAVKDAWLTTQIQARYFVDEIVKARQIDVDTRNGVVTLSGDVTSAAERQRAVARAREVDGVTRVVDHLRVASAAAGTSGRSFARPRAESPSRPGPADRVTDEISDAWVTAKVQSKYYLDPDVRGLQINVSTSGGVVTLEGRVADEAARNRALGIAKATEGVQQVIDRLVIARAKG